jgi:parvulin-like peptidyl-prolyl isomerase
MKPGEISGPVPVGSNGVVFALLDKQEPSAAEFDQQKDQIRQTILQRKRGEAIQLYVSSLKDKLQKDGKIRINDKEIQRLSTAAGNTGS